MTATDPTLPTEPRRRRWPLSGLASAYLTLFLVVFALELPGIIFGRGKDGSLAGVFSGILVLPVGLAMAPFGEVFLHWHPSSLAAVIAMVLLAAAIMTGIIEGGVRFAQWIARCLSRTVAHRDSD